MLKTFVWDPVAAEERRQEALIEYTAIFVYIQSPKGSSRISISIGRPRDVRD